MNYHAPHDSNAEQRQPPNNIEVEQGLLGALLINNDLYRKISDTVTAEHFFEPVHQQIYSVCSKLIDAGKLASPVTVKTFMTDVDIGDGMTVPQYLARLAAEASTFMNGPQYAEVVRDLWLRRAFISVSADLNDWAYDAPADAKIDDGLSLADERLQALRPYLPDQSDYVDFNVSTTMAIDQMASAYKNEGRGFGATSGLNNLDDKIGGYMDSDLIIVAARPGIGKTSLALRGAYEIAKSLQETGNGVVSFASLEMPKQQISMRLLAHITGIPMSRQRRGDFSEHEFTVLSDAARSIARLPIKIDDKSNQSIAQLAGRLRAIHRRTPVRAVFVDYIQLMKGSRDANRRGKNEEVSEITAGLKNLAKELGCPVIALSQLNRDLEKRDNKRPILSDLRDSGSIEQDADVVLMIYRDEFYLRNNKPREGTEQFFKWEREMEEAHGRAEIIIAKQRAGALATVHCGFNGPTTWFNEEPPDILPRSLGDGQGEKAPSGPRFTSDEEIGLRILYAMNMTREVKPEVAPAMPPGHENARLIRFEEWKKEVGERVLLDDEKKVDALARKILGGLRKKRAMDAAKSVDGNFVYSLGHYDV